MLLNFKKIYDGLYFVLSTQIWSTNIRFSKIIMKNNAQKHMTKFGFGCTFNDLNNFELDPPPSYSLDLLYN